MNNNKIKFWEYFFNSNAVYGTGFCLFAALVVVVCEILTENPGPRDWIMAPFFASLGCVIIIGTYIKFKKRYK